MNLIEFEAPDKQGAIIQLGWLQDALYKGSVMIQEELQEAKKCDIKGKIDWLETQLGFINSFSNAATGRLRFLLHDQLLELEKMKKGNNH